MIQDAVSTNEESRWIGLYKAGGIAGLVVSLLTLSEVALFIVYPQPGSVADWFSLFNRSPVVGVLDFWGLELPMYAMFILVFLALQVALRTKDESRTTIATALVLLGAGVFFVTNNPFSMLSLSHQYAAATTDTHRSAILAAGHVVLTNTGQRAIGGVNVALLLVSAAGLLSSSVMLRARGFSRFASYSGFVAHGLSLVDYFRQALTSSATIALLIIVPGAVFVMIWFTVVGVRLLRMANSGG